MSCTSATTSWLPEPMKMRKSEPRPSQTRMVILQLAPVFGALRAMTMEATASKTTAFDRVQRSKKREALAPAITELRRSNFFAWHFLRSVLFREDPVLRTAGDRLEYLLTGSPKGRYFVNYRQKNVNQKGGKILVTEDVPVSAFFLEKV